MAFTSGWTVSGPDWAIDGRAEGSLMMGSSDIERTPLTAAADGLLVNDWTGFFFGGSIQGCTDTVRNED